MYVQWCVKGISGGAGGITLNESVYLITSGSGIVSNWWRKKQIISPADVSSILNDYNLDRHLHDYANYGPNTPFISLASGCVERDSLLQRNVVYSAVDTALLFATNAWKHPGALFYCWTSVGLNPAVEISAVSEAVRDLNSYRRWSPYQLEGEITAKVQIPSNQISHVEWWDGALSTAQPQNNFVNLAFVDPAPVTNLRDLF
jgi:hypothetical protein